MNSSMKPLLAAIETALQGGISYMRDSDIYITDDLYRIPAGRKFPSCAVKDGVIKGIETPGGQWVLAMNVSIAVFVRSHKETEAIMGNTTTSAKGILDCEADVIGTLSENLLDLEDEGVVLALWTGSEESEKFEDETEAIQMKIIKFQYEKEEDRP